VDVNRVIQVAMLVTDANLNVISTEFNTVIHQSDEVIENMNDWCKENLKDLAVASKASQVTEQKAEDMMLAFIKQYITQPRLSPLAGNSIYMDRMFLRKYFPRVDEYLHYRIVDVSTVKELCGRWNKKVYTSAPQKKLKHRALEDIHESINELKHYKENFFIVDN
jgi:oligoribonuclease